MTKLNQLIAELCPQGVPFMGLDDIVEISTGAQLNKNDLDSDGPYAYYNGGSSPSGAHSEFNTAAGTAIVSQGGASAGFVNYVEEPFWAGAHCYVLKPKAEVDSRFLFFSLKAAQSRIQAAKVGAGIPGLNRSALKAISIQVPPLPVQLEIVRILNEFTLLEAELEAELEARKKQFEHYRNELLSFKHLGQGGVRWVTMDDVLQYEQPGKYLVATKEYSDNFPTPVLTAGQTFILGYTDEDHGIYPASAENPVIIFDDFTCANKFVDFAFKAKSSAMKMLTPKSQLVDLRFAYFFMQTVDYQPSDHARHWIGTFSKFKFPLPSLLEQKRIVKILDSFDELVNGMREGLPAEITARRKQYEYYREQLLNFDELVEA